MWIGVALIEMEPMTFDSDLVNKQSWWTMSVTKLFHIIELFACFLELSIKMLQVLGTLLLKLGYLQYDKISFKGENEALPWSYCQEVIWKGVCIVLWGFL